jgi:hypothetical protein
MRKALERLFPTCRSDITETPPASGKIRNDKALEPVVLDVPLTSPRRHPPRQDPE